MAAVFVDEIYDKLDPISQMVEPFQCPVIDLLSLIPEEKKLSLEESRALMIKIMTHPSGPYIKVCDVVELIFPNVDLSIISRIRSTSAYSSILPEILSVDIQGEFCYNSTTGQVISDCTFTLRKGPNITESNVMNMILTKIAKSVFFPNSLDADQLARVKDLAEILEAKVEHKTRRSSSYWSKVIENALLEKIHANQWRIRSSQAMIDLVRLIDEIISGHSSNWHISKINLIHVKAIARTNKPIYKIAEL